MRSREGESVFCLTGCEEKGIQVRRLEYFAYVVGVSPEPTGNVGGMWGDGVLKAVGHWG